MKELKTLKDLEKDAGEVRVTWGDEIVEVDEVREEAIKWVKEMEKEGQPTLYFKHFFNLTEGDLNEN